MKQIGYFLLVLSMLTWGLIFLLPFTGISTSEMAAYGAVLYVVSYALFFAGGILVGKEAIEALKQLFWRRFRGESQQPQTTDEPSLEP